MNFVVNGYDFTDDKALERRMSVREQHMATILEMKNSGKIVFAAAKIDKKGNMCGSTIYLEVESEDEVERYLDKEVYISGKVWDKVTVEICKIPPLFK